MKVADHFEKSFDKDSSVEIRLDKPQAVEENTGEHEIISQVLEAPTTANVLELAILQLK